MKDGKTYRLHPAAVAEPLMNRWAVWLDLISPVPYSLHLTNYQLKTMVSYCADPGSHVRASRDPALAGGPFIDIPAARSGEVKALADASTREQSDNIALAEALFRLSDTLTREAKGQSLEPSYSTVPEPLRGYVELVYDYFNHPIVRVIEPLAYESPYYKPHLQSIRLFRASEDTTGRPFFLNTPRLPDSAALDWPVPFASEKLDRLFSFETQPAGLPEICELLDVEIESPKVRSLLTAAGRAGNTSWNESSVRLRYFGHACVLLEWNGISVLTDPWIGPPALPGGPDRFSFDDLPERIDFAIITHGHHDHLVVETLLRLRQKIDCLVVPRGSGIFYADSSLKLATRRLGFRHVVEMQEFDTIGFNGGRILAVPFLGEHADLPHAKVAYVVSAGGQNILFGADSNCLDRRIYESLRRHVGNVQTVFLGMECVGAPLTWLYGAFLPSKLPRAYSQSRRTKGCDRKAAIDIAETLGCRRLYVYAMGREPWLQYAMGIGSSDDSPQIRESDALISELRARGVDTQRPFAKFETILRE